MSNVPFRIKQDKAEIRKQKETVTSFAILKTKLHLASVIAGLIMMLARDIFRSHWGFCTRVETRLSAIARVSGHGLHSDSVKNLTHCLIPSI